MRNSTLMKSLFALTMGCMAVSNAQAGTPFKENKIPGTIEAEDYDKGGDGVSFHWGAATPKTNTGGDYRTDVGFIGGPKDGTRWIGEMDGGVWTVYTVTIEQDGDYDLDTYYSTKSDGKSFKLTIGDFDKTISVPATGEWESFGSYVTTRALHLTAGTNVEMKFETSGGFNLDKFVFKYAGAKSSGHGLVIPGKIEAEEFDDGGEGTAYHWINTGATGKDYRSDANFVGNGGTGHNLGWTDGGDWTNYTVTVEKTGFYKMTYNAASGGGNGGSFYFRDLEGNRLTNTCAYPNTGGWDTYKEYEVTNIYLKEGSQTLQWYCGGGVNIDYFNFEYIGTTAEVTAVVPGTIEAEDYDEGTFVFTNYETKGAGAEYRANQKVYLEKGGSGYTINNTSGGKDQFSYTFKAEAGTYTIKAYVACGNTNGKFKITIDDSYDSGETAIPNNGWGSYDTPVALENVTLTAGNHTMTFYVLGDCNIDRFEFVKDTSTGISTVKAQAEENVWYNLQGQSVAQPTKGIYIRNGKKIIVK